MVNREYIENIEFEQGVTIIKLTGSITLENLEAVQKDFRTKTKGANIKNIIFNL
ncbi:MAG: hypothetical protein JSW18_02685 [Candidatus Omnitrophota bacterium]|nr:MAG: hypothetical protein JSW18_02685 [Candidatus Omnitrophota bacterium]